MSLGEQLRRAREEAGLSQETVALDSGVDRSYISDLERDLHSPTVDRLLRICGVIGIKVSELFRRLEAE